MRGPGESYSDVIVRIAVQKWEAGQSETVSDLKVDVRGLYLLAAPSTPTRTRQRAKKRPWTALSGSARGDTAKARKPASAPI
jgi:hypothetical protein